MYSLGNTTPPRTGISPSRSLEDGDLPGSGGRERGPPGESRGGPARLWAMLRIRPVTRALARAFVAAHHSHHRAHVGEVFTLGAFVDAACVGVSVMGRPVAVRLDDGETWEVTRLCTGPGAPAFTASRLLGASSRVALAAGVTLLTSYTRVDERGTCYRAAN